MLGNFGGSYKKAPDIKTDGRTQMPVALGKGRDECDKLWDACTAAFGNKALVETVIMPKAIESVFKVAWMFGYDAALKGCSPTPNGLGMLKLPCAGEDAPCPDLAIVKIRVLFGQTVLFRRHFKR